MRTLTFSLVGEITTVITITELDDGSLRFDITQSGDTSLLGDYRALFFDVTDDTLLSGLSASGADVTDSAFDAESVSNLGGGANVNGDIVNELGDFDGGVELGTAGISTDDIRTTSFILSHDTTNLTLEF